MNIHIKQENKRVRIIAANLGGGWKDRDYGLFTTETAIETIQAIRENQPGAQFIIDKACPLSIKQTASALV